MEAMRLWLPYEVNTDRGLMFDTYPNTYNTEGVL